MISEKYKFIVFHIPKSAGSSVLQLLQRLGEKPNDQNKKLSAFCEKNNIQWPNHITIASMYEFLGEEKFSSMFKFAFVRNPWDRLVSSYHYNKQKAAVRYENKNKVIPKFVKNIIESESFAQWVKAEKYLGETQISYLKNNDKILIDYLGRTETFQQDFSYICGWLGLSSNLTLPHVNKSKRRDYHLYYDAESVQIVQDYFLEDILMFGYKFEDQSDTQFEYPLPTAFGQRVQLTVKNLNKWCMPCDVGTKNLLIHPGNKPENDPEFIFHNVCLNGAKRIATTGCAFNPNQNNAGSVLKINITAPDGTAINKRYSLEPLAEKPIEIDFPHPMIYCDIGISATLPEGATTNAGTAIRMTKFELS